MTAKAFASGKVVVILAGVMSLAAAPPATMKAPTELHVDGEGITAVAITPAELAKKTHVEVKVTEHSGEAATYSGVPLRELLAAAGAPLGDEHLRGKAMALYVVAEGADGYRAVIALPELDAGFTDATVIVADKRNGVALAANEGPFKLIVPQDKKQGRWVRFLAGIHVERAVVSSEDKYTAK